MSEKPIRQNTIVSTTDKRLTLLQWLKQVQGQLKDLKEKGVKAVVEEFDTAESFYNAYSTKPAGTSVLTIVGSDTAIYGTLNEFTDKVNVKGIIYQGDKVYTSASADALSIVGGEELASTELVNSSITTALAGMKYKLFDYDEEAEFANAIKSNLFQQYIGNFVTIRWKIVDSSTVKYNYAFGYVWFNSSNSLYISGIYIGNNSLLKPSHFYHLDPYITAGNYGNVYDSGRTQIITNQNKESKGVFAPVLPNSNDYDERRYGFRKAYSSLKIYTIAGMGASNTTLQGIAIDETKKEIYYGLNGYMTITNSGVVENAVSGTELKEAVQRANQKTYWHSVKIKGANGIFTFNAPSTLNTPIVSTEKLLELFNNDTWAGFGKLGTDMLFAISLLNDNIEFIKGDDTKVSLGAFGTIEIRDDVKEVK